MTEEQKPVVKNNRLSILKYGGIAGVFMLALFSMFSLGQLQQQASIEDMIENQTRYELRNFTEEYQIVEPYFVTETYTETIPYTELQEYVVSEPYTTTETYETTETYVDKECEPKDLSYSLGQVTDEQNCVRKQKYCASEFLGVEYDCEMACVEKQITCTTRINNLDSESGVFGVLIAVVDDFTRNTLESTTINVDATANSLGSETQNFVVKSVGVNGNANKELGCKQKVTSVPDKQVCKDITKTRPKLMTKEVVKYRDVTKQKEVKGFKQEQRTKQVEKQKVLTKTRLVERLVEV